MGENYQINITGSADDFAAAAQKTVAKINDVQAMEHRAVAKTVAEQNQLKTVIQRQADTIRQTVALEKERLAVTKLTVKAKEQEVIAEKATAVAQKQSLSYASIRSNLLTRENKKGLMAALDVAGMSMLGGNLGNAFMLAKHAGSSMFGMAIGAAIPAGLAYGAMHNANASSSFASAVGISNEQAQAIGSAAAMQGVKLGDLVKGFQESGGDDFVKWLKQSNIELERFSEELQKNRTNQLDLTTRGQLRQANALASDAGFEGRSAWDKAKWGMSMMGSGLINSGLAGLRGLTAPIGWLRDKTGLDIGLGKYSVASLSDQLQTRNELANDPGYESGLELTDRLTGKLAANKRRNAKASDWDGTDYDWEKMLNDQAEIWMKQDMAKYEQERSMWASTGQAYNSIGSDDRMRQGLFSTSGAMALSSQTLNQAKRTVEELQRVNSNIVELKSVMEKTSDPLGD